MNAQLRRVWRRVIESGAAFRGFDSSSESAWLPVLAPYGFPDDPAGEARAKLLAVSSLAAWLAQPPSLDPCSLVSVDETLRGVHECRALLNELARVLEIRHAALSDGDE